MKYLYVLSSNESDTYLEQALLSIVSLRIVNPNSFITLLMDNSTKISLTGKREKILSLINEHVSVDIEEKYNKKAVSRWLKTSMRKYITGDFLYIDTDTIIADDISALDNFNINLGAVLNEHTHLSSLKNYNPNNLNKMQELDKKLGFSSTINSDTYFNSGILLCRDCTLTHNFFNEWHRQWQICFNKNSITDQQSFNQTNYIQRNIITELEGIWNCQILADGGINYFHNAKIIHYFAGMSGENPYIPASQKIIAEIKETGIINSKIMEMVKNPKCLFVPNARLRVVSKFERSATHKAAKLFFNTKFGACIDLILTILYKKIIKPLRKRTI